MGIKAVWAAGAAVLAAAIIPSLHAQPMTVSRGEVTVMVEPYADNVVRVSIGILKDRATAAPGYGISAQPLATGWTSESGAAGDVLRSARLTVTVAPQGPRNAPTGTQADIAKFFGGSTPGIGISIKTRMARRLSRCAGGRCPSQITRTATPASSTIAAPQTTRSMKLARLSQPQRTSTFTVSARTRKASSTAAATSCAAPTTTTLSAARAYVSHLWLQIKATAWSGTIPPEPPSTFPISARECASPPMLASVSRFFVIAGKTYDEIYSGYRLLTGDVPMLPKSAYGYIQCKQRYTSQAELMAVAKGYRDRHLPADVLVIDWFHDTKMGEMDMDPAKWPDPAGMNRELHAMGFHTMISVWPRFIPEDRYYKTILDHGWFMHLADGTPTNGLPYDRAGSDIDTTNPDAARWYWGMCPRQLRV
jgi:alpha-D-xyloside xylohydrolase